jgi:predicted PurR-regulated permease PerM
MNDEKSTLFTRSLTRYLLFLAGTIVALFVLWNIKSILIYILISAFISLIGKPLVDFLSKIRYKRVYIPRPLIAMMTLIVFWTIIFAFFLFFVPLLINQANEISAINAQQLMIKLQPMISSVEDFAMRMHLIDIKDFSLQEYVRKTIVPMISVSKVSDIFQFLFGLMGNIFIAFFSISFISFFFLKEEYMFSDVVLLFTPVKYENNVKHVLISIYRLITRYFIGIVVEGLIVMTMLSIGLTIAGMNLQNALVVGLFSGILIVIPYVGPMLGGLFGLMMGVVSSLKYPAGFDLGFFLATIVLVFVIVYAIDSGLIQPYIYSSSVNAHPLEIFLVILIFGNLSGIVGMIMAIPTYTILRVIAKEFFNGYKVIKKITANM